MYSNFYSNTFLGLLLSLSLATAVSAEQRHYPSADQSSVVIGSEQYDENYTSLAGLEGVHVVSKYVLDSAKKYELTDMKPDLVEQIKQRLNRVGLRMLSETDLEKTPGLPTLTFFPSYSGNDIAAIKSKTEEPGAESTDASDTTNETLSEQEEIAAHDCCRSSIWASFQQSSTILRAPNKHYKFATWGLGEDTDDCENRGAWTYEAVLKVVDKFVADFSKAQSESGTEIKPKLVSAVADAPKSCDQAWLVNLDVFKTNQTNINEAVKPILNELAVTASLCVGYRYTIETHADQRADSNYNRLLSEARGMAIKDYLISREVSYDRLKTVAFGESKPLSTGTSEQDHAVNRRVTIIPHLGES